MWAQLAEIPPTLQWTGKKNSSSPPSWLCTEEMQGGKGCKRGYGYDTHLHPLGLRMVNHRLQCPHVWRDKCFSSGKGFIFMLSFLLLWTFFFFKHYSNLQNSWRSQQCLAQRELPTETKCIVFYFLSDHDDVLLETWLYQQQDRDVLDQKSNDVHAAWPAIHFRINLENISPEIPFLWMLMEL